MTPLDCEEPPTRLALATSIMPSPSYEHLIHLHAYGVRMLREISICLARIHVCLRTCARVCVNNIRISRHDHLDLSLHRVINCCGCVRFCGLSLSLSLSCPLCCCYSCCPDLVVYHKPLRVGTHCCGYTVRQVPKGMPRGAQGPF